MKQLTAACLTALALPFFLVVLVIISPLIVYRAVFKGLEKLDAQS